MTKSRRCGISVDIGTTNITLHLTNLDSGALIKETTFRNPQSDYGDEIISRIDFARSPDNAKLLTTIVRQSISDGIAKLLQDSIFYEDTIDSVVVVGNTVMHHLYFGLSTSSLLKPPYRAEYKDSIATISSKVGLTLKNNPFCYSPPLVESFIGADAVAMMLLSGFLETESGLVSIDVGTNTEIAAIKDGNIWIASAASGPAFEGMSIECGTTGDEGAISKVCIDPFDFHPRYVTIGNRKAKGICGSGAVSAIASMLETGILLPRGSFDRSQNNPWLVTDEEITHYILAPSIETATNSHIILTQPDIRMLQQSKASIRSALSQVLQNTRLDSDEVSRLFLTGVFGTGLAVPDAVRIGLFPEMANAEVIQVKGGASMGADLLHQQRYREYAKELVAKANYIELTDNPDFKKEFTENLPFP
jgi:uncharacterized 2Fe-2S/4Fe-4S cluster protein (DUF4445 family)